jgi:shikimate kinase
MGQTVILVGFSCSGKSSIGEKISKKFPNQVDILIAEKYGSSIAEIFLTHERDDAVALIENEERIFLDSIHAEEKARLIVAGPNLVLRDPQWEDFLTRINPVIFYLQVSPGMCYARLKARHDHYAELYAGHARRDRIGSWNKGILCDLDQYGKYEDISREEALSRIPILMREQVTRYEKIADPARTIDCKRLEHPPELRIFVEKVGDALIK